MLVYPHEYISFGSHNSLSSIIILIVEAYIGQQYLEFDNNSCRISSSMAQAIPVCDDYTFTNSKGIYQFLWNRLHCWFFYKNSNNDAKPQDFLDDNNAKKIPNKILNWILCRFGFWLCCCYIFIHKKEKIIIRKRRSQLTGG